SRLTHSLYRLLVSRSGRDKGMWPYRIPGSSSSAATSIIRWSLLLIVLPMCAQARFPIEKWECGSDGWTKTESHKEVIKKCPHFAEEINHCCVVHDDCYGRQKGQKYCDTEFDACNKRVLDDERAGPCKEIVELAYAAVDFMGFIAYTGSTNYTEPHEKDLPQLCRPEKTMGVFFDYLYLSCPTIKKSISSCCDQLTVCPDLPLGRNRTECANRAMGCLVKARSEEHNGFNDGHCDRALDRTRKYLALDYIMEDGHVGAKKHHGPPEIFANSNQAFALLMILSMTCGICLLLVTYKYYRLRSQNKDRKYSTITLSTA
ncbi:hypothetical protein PENTCL1PPCAC_3984, partial [Pristionchus entomophagus]